MKSKLFYHKQPVFGLDIGSQSVKAMQLELRRSGAVVKGYGSVSTTPDVMKNGAIVDIKKAAQQIDELLAKQMVGQLTTNSVVMAIPVSRVFTRVLSLPTMSKKELERAVALEVEQSIPLPAKDLYFDHEITESDNPGTMLVRMVAAPRAIVDSYVSVCGLLGLDLALVQTNIEANAQLCLAHEQIDKSHPYIIVDVGGSSVDVGILDSTLRVTGTVEAGGNSITDAIAAKLGVGRPKAQELKIGQGLNTGENQADIAAAVSPILKKVVAEIKTMIRFYEERVQNQTKVSQIIIFGGGANMPGLAEYLTDNTRVPSRVSSPWANFLKFGHLEPPEHADLPKFLTCAGLASVNTNEVVSL